MCWSFDVCIRIPVFDRRHLSGTESWRRSTNSSQWIKILSSHLLDELMGFGSTVRSSPF